MGGECWSDNYQIPNVKKNCIAIKGQCLNKSKMWRGYTGALWDMNTAKLFRQHCTTG